MTRLSNCPLDEILTAKTCIKSANDHLLPGSARRVIAQCSQYGMPHLDFVLHLDVSGVDLVRGLRGNTNVDSVEMSAAEELVHAFERDTLGLWDQEPGSNGHYQAPGAVEEVGAVDKDVSRRDTLLYRY